MAYAGPTPSSKHRLASANAWKRPQLARRDRRLITCAALVATGKTEQVSFHFPRALEDGVTREELVELITHLAFYVGWPNAMSAVPRQGAAGEESALRSARYPQ